jgi:hypothetical protein
MTRRMWWFLFDAAFALLAVVVTGIWLVLTGPITLPRVAVTVGAGGLAWMLPTPWSDKAREARRKGQT